MKKGLIVAALAATAVAMPATSSADSAQEVHGDKGRR